MSRIKRPAGQAFIDTEGIELPTPQRQRLTNLLTVHLHEGHIVAIGDRYGVRINIDYATRAGFSAKRLAARSEPAHALAGKVQHRTRKGAKAK